MSIKFFCTCGKKLKVDDDVAGKKIVCPDCGSPVSVPRTSTTATSAPKKEAEHHSNSAGDMAGDLMKQTVAAEKARRHGDAPGHHHEKKEGFGVTDVAVYSATKAIPIVVGAVLLVGGAFWLSSQVLGPKANTPPLAEVSGTITLDGKPVPGALISFRPMEGPQDKPGSRGAASVGRSDAAGRYTLLYVSDIRGAVIGKHQVDIQAQNAQGMDIIPGKYRFQEPIVKEVRADTEKNVIDIELNSAP